MYPSEAKRLFFWSKRKERNNADQTRGQRV